MFSPPEVENNAQFVSLAEIFARCDIPVPEIIATEKHTGCFLLEDLGDKHLSKFYDQSSQDTVLHQAIDALVKIQQVKDPSIPAYTADRFYDELTIFSEWFLGKLFNQSLATDIEQVTWPQLIENATSQPQCCIHRDYHSQNLLLNHHQQLGIVDFQDALIGPVGYDLASLLRDCYHRFSERDIARYRQYYLANTSIQFDESQFERWFDLCAVQRQLKAVGIFVRLFFRDGKRNHLADVAPVIEHTQSLAAKYELTPLARLLDKIAPNISQRINAL
jgi:aminoglycoside/choline kinase family phosphotransferase